MSKKKPGRRPFTRDEQLASLQRRFPNRIADVGYNQEFVDSHIDASAGAQACWTWRGARHRQGYGMVGGYRLATGEKLMMTVHRLLLKIKLGRDPGTKDSVHTCGNMCCLNPDHLIEGTAREILELRVARTGKRFGKPVGHRLNRPREQQYSFGLENIVDLAQDRITVDEFAQRTNMTRQRAQKIKANIQAGRSYRWAVTYGVK